MSIFAIQVSTFYIMWINVDMVWIEYGGRITYFLILCFMGPLRLMGWLCEEDEAMIFFFFFWEFNNWGLANLNSRHFRWKYQEAIVDYKTLSKMRHDFVRKVKKKKSIVSYWFAIAKSGRLVIVKENREVD